MKYSPLDSATYRQHRDCFKKHLKPGAIALFQSNDIMPASADGTMPFRQSSDLLYLCGVDQEETILVMFPDAHNTRHREILFVKETSEDIAIWEGAKLTKEQARELTGITTVHWVSEFYKVLPSLMAEAGCVYLNSNEHTRAKVEVETREARFGKWLREQYPLHTYERSAPIMHRVRSVKSNGEIRQMQTACNITEKAFRRVLGMIKPGVHEFEIQAELAHEFLMNRSRGFAYEPIIASGFNACVLHYVANNQECKAGDVILMDVGAEYGNYASDMTRCVPVSGRFTERQKEVYNAVLRVMRGAMNLLRPGVFLADYHVQVGRMMEEELLKLGLLTAADIQNQNPDWPAYKKYFMHGTSHFIGLDVHDVGLWYEPIQAGNVFTVEPGIYIREENLGIRLENDILITENGFVDLMANIPLEADEIEALMNA
ncbi:MAG: M24 family metallopeptidase [Cryomorphaceae bacterium]|nr:MAG: M24 family metallopeptidase [Cryomorphaceae bacterium]